MLLRTSLCYWLDDRVPRCSYDPDHFPSPLGPNLDIICFPFYYWHRGKLLLFFSLFFPFLF